MIEIKEMDAIIFAVSHEQFSSFTIDDLDGLYKKGKKVLLDVKGVFDRKDYEQAGYIYWRL